MSIHLNQRYNVVVLRIQDSFDSYEKKGGGGGTQYCHLCSLRLADGTEVDAQICTPQSLLSEFEDGDKISVEFNQFTEKKTPNYTFKFMSIVDKAVKETKHNPDLNQGAPSSKPSGLIFGNMDQRKERALAHAVTLHAMKPATDAVVLETARQFEQYLLTEEEKLPF